MKLKKLKEGVKVGKLKMSDNSGMVRANVTTSSFWAELPEKLPSLTTPVTTLTKDEQEILLGVLDRKLPVFSEFLTPETTSRTDPFN